MQSWKAAKKCMMHVQSHDEYHCTFNIHLHGLQMQFHKMHLVFQVQIKINKHACVMRCRLTQQSGRGHQLVSAGVGQGLRAGNKPRNSISQIFLDFLEPGISPRVEFAQIISFTHMKLNN